MKQKAFFLQRMNDHVQYLGKIKATLNQCGDFQGTDCHHCALGQWLYGEGQKEPSSLGEDGHALFEQLITPHEHFHQASARALNALEAGDEVGQYRAMTEMHQLSNHLVKTLLNLDRYALRQSRTA